MTEALSGSASFCGGCRTTPNGTRTEYGYDTRHRLTSIVHKDASNNTVLDSFTFTLDTEGNITQALNADGTKFVYTYDQRHRVTEGDLKDGGNNILRTYGYTYDAANNLTAKTRTVTSPYSSNSWVYAYDNANEQTSVTLNGGTPETRSYDDWGRMATRTQGSSSATFGYRYGGRQYSYATNFGGEAPETLQYRGDGRLYSRASGATTKVFRYDRGWNAIDEEDGAGNLTATSVYAPGAAVGARLAWVSGTMLSGTWDYAYHDQLGSTRRWRSATKALLGADDFGPFGEPYATSTVAPIDYALHAQDPYTLMYHAPYREYAAGWARWTTRDPLSMINGPNTYAYAKGRPICQRDPLGLQLEGIPQWLNLLINTAGGGACNAPAIRNCVLNAPYVEVANTPCEAICVCVADYLPPLASDGSNTTLCVKSCELGSQTPPPLPAFSNLEPPSYVPPLVFGCGASHNHEPQGYLDDLLVLALTVATLAFLGGWRRHVVSSRHNRRVQ